ncbi:DNA repair protein (plasmid) [Thermobacillus composti KWC4]|jgi:DNA repair protein RadC|uniref:DNA repair protein n=1 Tax=Thermobacillus composti (strain DSM 18247 / JCM 13945 / KWC4) TaxID=717605 RepID=L0EJP0_THECK|nr:DNA repair protein RadC [Thermobacillus composti]AGA59996.1 DNA repair protein [Thermobacillus composti KWC4]
MSVSELNAIAVNEAKGTYYRWGGVGCLSDKELLLLVLEPLIRNRSLSNLAEELLQKDWPYLASLSEFELSVMFGLNERQSFHLMAVFELARRVNRRLSDNVKIRSPEDVKSLLWDLQHLDREHFVCIFLNTKNKVIGRETISVGTLNAALVHPREVFKAAIRRGAASVVFAHNHPSGDPCPSPEDIAITRRLFEVGELVGIEVMDHVIIGNPGYSSMKELGYMPEKSQEKGGYTQE